MMTDNGNGNGEKKKNGIVAKLKRKLGMNGKKKEEAPKEKPKTTSVYESHGPKTSSLKTELAKKEEIKRVTKKTFQKEDPDVAELTQIRQETAVLKAKAERSRAKQALTKTKAEGKPQSGLTKFFFGQGGNGGARATTRKSTGRQAKAARHTSPKDFFGGTGDPFGSSTPFSSSDNPFTGDDVFGKRDVLRKPAAKAKKKKRTRRTRKVKRVRKVRRKRRK